MSTPLLKLLKALYDSDESLEILEWDEIGKIPADPYAEWTVKTFIEQTQETGEQTITEPLGSESAYSPSSRAVRFRAMSAEEAALWSFRDTLAFWVAVAFSDWDT